MIDDFIVTSVQSDQRLLWEAKGPTFLQEEN